MFSVIENWHVQTYGRKTEGLMPPSVTSSSFTSYSVVVLGFSWTFWIKVHLWKLIYPACQTEFIYPTEITNLLVIKKTGICFKQILNSCLHAVTLQFRTAMLVVSVGHIWANHRLQVCSLHNKTGIYRLIPLIDLPGKRVILNKAKFVACRLQDVAVRIAPG